MAGRKAEGAACRVVALLALVAVAAPHARHPADAPITMSRDAKLAAGESGSAALLVYLREQDLALNATYVLTGELVPFSGRGIRYSFPFIFTRADMVDGRLLVELGSLVNNTYIMSVVVSDAFPGLSAEEALLARREQTVICCPDIQVVDRGIVGKKRNVCVFDGECSQHLRLQVPRVLVRHDDSDLAYRHWGVGESEAACLSRARQWHVFCGNAESSPMTATFVPSSRRSTFPGARNDVTARSKAWVMLLHVTDGYMDFLENFLAHHQRIGQWSVEHVVKVVVSSKAAARTLKDRYGDMIEVSLGSDFGKQAFGFDDEGFTSVVQERISLIRQELLADRNVFYFDVDTVLLADPFPYLLPGYDIWTSMDHPAVHCTGVLAMLAVARSLDVLDDWEATMSETRRETSPVIGNQEVCLRID